MNLSNLKPAVGSKHRRKVVGRGRGSGHGGSSTRGIKGQNARSGRGTRPGFEGGQMPLYRRLPKRGFTSIFKKIYEVVNVGLLDEKFEANAEVNAAVLAGKSIIRKGAQLKVLGDGDLKKPLKITADKFSASALEKIKKAGGEAITPAAKKEKAKK